MTSHNKISESTVISFARRLKHHAASRVIQGIGDDCAVIRTPGGGAALITTDVFIEGVHFLPGQPPETVGGKLLAVNLSDIAAMGGRPGEAVVVLMLPSETPSLWVEKFFDGLNGVAKEFGVNLVGGDVSRHPDRITIALTLTGRIRRDEVLYRAGGKHGDLVFVSGTLGDADAGLDLLRRSELPMQPSYDVQALTTKYLAPVACIELGRLLAKTHTASSAIDLSDGLATGARQLAEAGGVALELDCDTFPLSDDLRAFCKAGDHDPLQWVLESGGDYELLFTVPPANLRRVERFRKSRPDLPLLTRIGRVVEELAGRVVVNRGGRAEELVVGGWEHFTER